MKIIQHLLNEFKVFHSPTGHYWHSILTTLPLEKAVKAMGISQLHIPIPKTMLCIIGLKGLPGYNLTFTLSTRSLAHHELLRSK